MPLRPEAAWTMTDPLRFETVDPEPNLSPAEPAWVEAGAKALADEGGLPGSSIHSWRCEYPDRYGPCDCVAQTVAEILAAVEPLIRADERERMQTAIDASNVAEDAVAIALAHAESVAVRLVEVICDMDAERQHYRKYINRQVGTIEVVEAERDAARAEVAALTRWKAEATAVIEAWEQVHTLLGSPGRLGESKAAATYAEVDALRRGLRVERRVNDEFVRWKADLRAKVMNLSSRVELNEVGHEVTWVRYADILALIEEAGQ